MKVHMARKMNEVIQKERKQNFYIKGTLKHALN